MIKTIFYLKTGKKNEIGEIAIYAKISLPKDSTTLSTGKYISKSRWEKTNHLRNPRLNAKEKAIRTYLNNIKSKIESTFFRLDKENLLISAKRLKDNFLGKTQVLNKHSFNHIVEYHYNHFKKKVEAGERSSSTLQKYERASDLFKNFLKRKFGVYNIRVSKIDIDLIYDFEEYMRYDLKYKGEVNMGNNSAIKYIRRLGTIFNYAIKRDLIKSNPFAKHDGKITEPIAEFLTLDELKLIENKIFGCARLERIKNIFLFSCYTGYAPIDIKRLKKSNLVKDNDGSYWIYTHRTKTNIQSNVPLLPPALRIINKYNELDSDKLLPTLSSQKMNGYLKEIADLCGIQKHLTHYVARHTFATTITLGNGVRIENVSAMMGHTNLQRTKHYAKVLDKNVKDDMNNLSLKFN